MAFIPITEPEEVKATKSYSIPVGDLTLEDRRFIRGNADVKLVNNALTVSIREKQEDMIIRDALPNTDLGVAAPGGVALAAQEDWLMAAAGVVAVEGPLVWAVLPNDRCIAFFGLGAELPVPNPVSRVRFQLGAGAVRGVFQLEQLQSRLETAMFFSEPVIFSHNEQVAIRVMPRIAFGVNTLRLHMYARTIEPIGAIVSAPSV